jgi:hypothetical protein
MANEIALRYPTASPFGHPQFAVFAGLTMWNSTSSTFVPQADPTAWTAACFAPLTPVYTPGVPGTFTGDYVASMPGGVDLTQALTIRFYDSPAVPLPQTELPATQSWVPDAVTAIADAELASSAGQTLQATLANQLSQGTGTLATDSHVLAIPTTPLLAANYVAPDNADIATILAAIQSGTYGLAALETLSVAIKAKTDNLPALPASTTNITAASGVQLAGSQAVNVTQWGGGTLPTAFSANNLPGDYLSSAEQAQLTSAAGAQQVGSAVTLPATIPAGWIGTGAGQINVVAGVVAAYGDWMTSIGNVTVGGYASGQQPLLSTDSRLPSGGTLSTYAGADTAGTTTLLARVPAFPANFSTLALTNGQIIGTSTFSVSQLPADYLSVAEQNALANLDATISSRASDTAATTIEVAIAALPTGITPQQVRNALALATTATIESGSIDAQLASIGTGISAIQTMITSAGLPTLVLTSPVALNQQTLTLVRGDDYNTTTAQQIQFSLTNCPSLSGAVVVLYIRTKQTLGKMLQATMTVAGSNPTTLTCSLTHAQTANLVPDASGTKQLFDVVAMFGDDSQRTLLIGNVVVLANISW